MYPAVADYRRLAQARLPRFAFDYLDGATEDGESIRRNRAGFQDLLWRPRALRDVSLCDLSRHFFDECAAAPFAVGPTGLNGLFWPDADIHLARAAAKAGVPFILSSASTSLLEDVRAAVPDSTLWLQLYVQQDRSIAEDLMRRARASGFSTLLLTVDTATHGKRDHDVRNGFKLPIKPSLKLAAGLLAHPRWSLQMLTRGGPQLVNMARSMGQAQNLSQQAAALSRAMDLTLGWADIAWLKRHWDGPVMIKGLHTIDDARLALEHGASGIVLSNHGGRQLEGAMAPIEVLPSVVDALGDRLSVFVDGGVRRGGDAIKAVALGARGVLLGRAPLYGLAARGPSGVSEVLSLLQDEMAITLRLLGCQRLSELNRTYLARKTPLPTML